MLVVAWLVLLAYTAAGVWQPPGVPRWLNQVLAVALGTPLATLLLYMGLVGGQWTRFAENHGLVRGYFILTGIVLSIAPLLALVALCRERDGQARNQLLRFELEKATLERQALDARLRLLRAQIEPHFLFNTLANVQELVESGSAQAGAVLKHLIAYLRGAMPHLHDDAATLGNEAALVRAYLELMHMRMPDRLRFAIELPGGLADVRLPAMALLTLVENAIHHGIDPAEQGGTVEVRGWRDTDGRVHVAVIDTGIGMDATAAARHRARQPAGTAGCVLRRGRAARADRGRAARRAGADRLRPGRIRRRHPDRERLMSGPTALIADDEPLLRERLRALLARLWPALAIVGEARNGREAIELFETHAPQVVFLGSHMPGADGIEAARTGSSVRLIPVEQIVYLRADEKYTLVVWDGGEALIRRTIRELADELDPNRFAQIHRSVIVNLHRVAQVQRGLHETAEVHLKERPEVLPVSRSYVHVFRQM
ncbi:MAG: LytTR family transcriptional regulator DNA-binding domain-containing protein [Burkholderiaceae bacterium]